MMNDDCVYNIINSSPGEGMPHNMLSFNSVLIYLITPEMQGMVNLKRIACFA